MITEALIEKGEMKANLETGTAGKWAKAAINYFRDNSVGGGMYRETGA